MKPKFHAIIAVSLCGIVLSGCATSNSKSSAPQASTSASSLPTLPAEAYQSFRHAGYIMTDGCPSSDRGLMKIDQVQLSRMANGCIKTQKWDHLRLVGNAMAQKFPTSPWGAYYLSLSSEKTKQYARALWMIDLALKKSPKEAMLHYQKARIHWLMNENSSALAAFNESLKHNPQFVDSLLFLGQVNYRNQNYKMAEKYFASVLEIEKDNQEAFAGLTEVKQVLEKGDKRKLVAK